MHRYDEAAESCRRALDLDPYHLLTLSVLTEVRAHQHRAGEALAAAEQAVQAHGRFFMTLAALAEAYGAAGRKEDTHRVLEELQGLGRAYLPPGGIARIYSILEDTDASLECAGNAVE